MWAWRRQACGVWHVANCIWLRSCLPHNFQQIFLTISHTLHWWENKESGLAAFAVSVLHGQNFTAYLLVALAQRTHLSTVIYFMCAWFFLHRLLLLLLLHLHLHLHLLVLRVFCCSCVYFLFIFHFMLRLATVATGYSCCFACYTAAQLHSCCAVAA